jgi:peptide/nickel transport system permease protein
MTSLRLLVAFTLRRLVQLVSVVFVVVMVTAVLLRVVPGDPARAILGVRASEDSLAAMRAELGVDQPLLKQLWHVLRRLVSGDLGYSVVQATPVTHIVAGDLGVTLLLVALALLFGTVSGLVIGLAAGTRRHGLVRPVLGSWMVLGLAVPTFVLGLVLLYVFGIALKWAPAGGWQEGIGSLRYLWVPALALSAYLAALTARSTARATATVVESQFFEAAVSRGLSRRRLVVRHVLPNSLLPAIVIVGVNAAYLVSGAVTIEAVFGLPGLGTELARAAQNRDFPVVQGIAVVTAVIVVVVSWITEVLLALLDPRVRHAR